MKEMGSGVLAPLGLVPDYCKEVECGPKGQALLGLHGLRGRWRVWLSGSTGEAGQKGGTTLVNMKM